jgi:hypothetical protein
MTAWSNPQIVGFDAGGNPVIADLGDGLGHDALVGVVLVTGYSTVHPPGYPFREDPGDHVTGDFLSLLKPEADALVAAGLAAYAGVPDEPDEPPTGPPLVIDAPYCGGSGIVGEPLTVTMGNWENKPTDYAYLWKKQVGSTVVSLQETSNSYTPTNQDVGKQVFATVAAQNALGTSAVDSNKVTVAAEVQGMSR